MLRILTRQAMMSRQKTIRAPRLSSRTHPKSSWSCVRAECNTPCFPSSLTNLDLALPPQPQFLIDIVSERHRLRFLLAIQQGNKRNRPVSRIRIAGLCFAPFRGSFRSFLRLIQVHALTRSAFVFERTIQPHIPENWLRLSMYPIRRP